MADQAGDAPRIITLRYAGKCSLCGAGLAPGTKARWDKQARTASCVECPATAAVPAVKTAASATPAGFARRIIKLCCPGTCAACGAAIPARAEALGDEGSRTATCVSCAAVMTERVPGPEPPAPPARSEPVTDPQPYRPNEPRAKTVAGGSAKAEFQRRHAKRDAALEARWGRLAGIAKFLSDDPQSTRAWATGAEGERRLAIHMERVLADRAVFLHDRKGRTSQIDHLVIASSGVWVVDAKSYGGRVEYRNVGGWLGPADHRIYVGGRDKTKLAVGLVRQVEAVRNALGNLGAPVHPVLCFVNGDNWGLFQKPFRHDGVLVTWANNLCEAIAEPGVLGPEEVEDAARRLAGALKPGG